MAFERYRFCEFLLPMDRDLLLEAAEAAGTYEETAIVEVECGLGAGISLIAKTYGCGGLGVDPREGLIAQAIRRAVRLGVSEQVSFVARPMDDLGIGVAQFDVGLHIGSSAALGEEGARQFREALAEDSAMILAEPVWLEEKAEGLAARFLEPEAILEADQQIRAYEKSGWEVVFCETVPEDEWRRFDDALLKGLRLELAAYETWPERVEELHRVMAAVEHFHEAGGPRRVGIMVSVLEHKGGW